MVDDRFETRVVVQGASRDSLSLSLHLRFATELRSRTENLCQRAAEWFTEWGKKKNERNRERARQRGMNPGCVAREQLSFEILRVNSPCVERSRLFPPIPLVYDSRLLLTLSERMPPYSRHHKYSKRIECRYRGGKNKNNSRLLLEL